MRDHTLLLALACVTSSCVSRPTTHVYLTPSPERESAPVLVMNPRLCVDHVAVASRHVPPGDVGLPITTALHHALLERFPGLDRTTASSLPCPHLVDLGEDGFDPSAMRASREVLDAMRKSEAHGAFVTEIATTLACRETPRYLDKTRCTEQEVYLFAFAFSESGRLLRAVRRRVVSEDSPATVLHEALGTASR